ncbi:class I SAM-dependent methyltransferase [Inhella crocodyli]|uniref:class I SAM-dependent methyltransferase n=1 Tax=Inhella crocodyli TaxID=2499851 RepID=UPI001F0C5484|nr:class I SAM-dependent methyltransferase [Inhella crocodyli]
MQERMADEAAILELEAWLDSPAGRYLLAWEQAQLDAAVADVFGFHALQLGWAPLQGLRANRMPQRWLALPHGHGAAQLVCDFDDLPFESNSLDLLVLPHTLESAADPHHRLREAYRVLRPEGRLMVLGLNPASLWGLRQRLGGRFLPQSGEFIAYWRLRDWLKLLGLELAEARFGCWRPPLQREAWLARWQAMDRLGATWWPVFGAAYFVHAIKRVHGMRLVGLARPSGARRRAPSVAVSSKASRLRLPAND